MTPTFLEISGRQAGKTHDLVEAARQHMQQGGTAIIVTGEGMDDHVERLAPGATVIRYGQHTDAPLLERIEELEKVRWFFDEFDWYSAVPIIQGGYYCTTARFKRAADASPEGDTLLTLVKELGGPTRQRSCPIEIDEHYPPEERAVLLHGKFHEAAP